MHRPVWFRVLISLWGIWFATALTEPAGLFACAMHSGAPAAVASHSSAPTAAVPIADVAHSDAHHHVDDASTQAKQVESTAPEHSDHSCCTCLGQCSTMSPATIPASHHAIVAAATAKRAVAPFAETATELQRAEHLLPFANGPPRIA